MRLFPTKRGWKRLGIGLAVIVALALIANGFMVWRTEARLQAILAKIRANGDPVSLADLAPEPIPADQNAAAIIESLSSRLEEFSREHGHYLNDDPTGREYYSHSDEMMPTTDQIFAIRSIVGKYPDLEEGIHAAAAADQYASVADFSLGHQKFLEEILEKRAQSVRSLARFCDWKMVVLIADGQPQQAAELGLQMLKIARLRDREPLLVNYLVNVAVRGIIAQRMDGVLASGPISAELHAAIDEELARQDSHDAIIQALKTERAYSATITASIGLDFASEEVNPLWVKFVGWPVKRLYIGALESYDQTFEIANKPWFEVNRRQESNEDSAMPTGYGVLADLLQPGLRAALVAHARSLVSLRALRIANALAQYRDEHGREASGLSDLSLPREATIDPFSGEPLKLKHTDDGWLIYSVMQNGIDDGGDFTDAKDYGLAPRKDRK
jgi:hypothetical protein